MRTRLSFVVDPAFEAIELRDHFQEAVIGRIQVTGQFRDLVSERVDSANALSALCFGIHETPILILYTARVYSSFTDCRQENSFIRRVFLHGSASRNIGTQTSLDRRRPPTAPLRQPRTRHFPRPSVYRISHIYVCLYMYALYGVRPDAIADAIGRIIRSKNARFTHPVIEPTGQSFQIVEHLLLRARDIEAPWPLS